MANALQVMNILRFLLVIHFPKLLVHKLAVAVFSILNTVSVA